MTLLVTLTIRTLLIIVLNVFGSSRVHVSFYNLDLEIPLYFRQMTFWPLLSCFWATARIAFTVRCQPTITHLA